MPEVGYCRDCRWWGYDSDRDNGWRTCLLTETHDNEALGWQLLKAVKALAMSCSKLCDTVAAELETAPDFGCVQFQPKERP